jgi:uncharacterized protein YfaS (alpha-2-macroglobulin family)
MIWGSDVLTSYLLAVANEAGWEIPSGPRNEMLAGLVNFVEGRIVRGNGIASMDLSVRKMAAVEALSRYGRANAELLGSIRIEPALWPTSAVIDWYLVLGRVVTIRDREAKRREADQILRSRLNFQGTVMTFSTDSERSLAWMMASTDSNANRFLLATLAEGDWREDMPRVVRGALSRQKRGHWDLTTANAWGVLALEKFAKAFEKDPVRGSTVAKLGNETKTQQWAAHPASQKFLFDWPSSVLPVTVEHQGGGKPWVILQSLAAIPLKEPFSTGFHVKKTLTPVQVKSASAHSRGDVWRVHLDLESQSDMTWVVVNDPIPSGSSVLGTGLGRDSALFTQTEQKQGEAWLAFEERSFEAFRAYFEYVPKGHWTVEYTLRLNQPGKLNLPVTRVEAMYAPEMFAEIPNATFEIGE